MYVMLSCWGLAVGTLLLLFVCFFFCQAEDGIRGRVRSRGLGDVYKRQMSRNAGTLSGGESQRIRLASQIGSGLTGVLYVLDLSLIHI